ncbi:MAG: DUF364 domain-containing protein [Rhodocyclaceae bacterium]|nr:DUF364 domain-containing protein [Rhodocyclaceae bacterium]
MSAPVSCPHLVYERILASLGTGTGTRIDQLCLGLTWTFCRTAQSIGFAQSPGLASRTLRFPGTVAGRPAAEVAAWMRSWDPFEATVGLAAANAVINGPGNALMARAVPICGTAPSNLAVFEHFRPCLERRKVVVVGRYPGLDALTDGLDVTVLERQPAGDDLPDPAAEYLVPAADWVFLTATSLINKTFPRLAELAANAVTVLMGPSVPWWPGFADFGIDFIAGVLPIDAGRAATIASEGGGTRLFGDGVRYAVADIGAGAMATLKRQIAATAERRAALKQAMTSWYDAGNRGRFPELAELEAVTDALAELDTRYKRQWDARSRRPAPPGNA